MPAARNIEITRAIWRMAEQQCCPGHATPLWRAMHGPDATAQTRAAARRWVAKECPMNDVPDVLLPFWHPPKPVFTALTLADRGATHVALDGAEE